jgi:hypothetical protein
MNGKASVAEQILQTVSHSPGCLLDEIVHACPDFTWNQIFLEIDRLSRRGEVLLKLEKPGVYRIGLPRLCASRSSRTLTASYPFLLGPFLLTHHFFRRSDSTPPMIP